MFSRSPDDRVSSSATLNELINNVAQGPEVSTDDAGFAVGAGGGTDIRLANHFAIRIAADYIRTFLFDDSQNNARGTVGIVYHWGEAGK